MKRQPPSEIASLILSVRGQRVMLDSDLASLYGVTTGNLNKAVARNTSRFPDDFMFRLTADEYRSLRFQSGILKRGEHSKYLPHVFTEEGVAMLSSVLRGERAALVNVAVMRAFVRLRAVLAANKDLAARLESVESRLANHADALQDHAGQIGSILEAIRQLMEPPEAPKRRIGFLEPSR